MKIDASLIRKDEKQKLPLKEIKINIYKAKKSFFLVLKKILNYELNNNDI